MLLVCLSHFAAVYVRKLSLAGSTHLPVLPWPIALGMIASPTFVAVSGTILGLLFVVRKKSFDEQRLKLVDRSLFVLTVAHVLIAGSQLMYAGSVRDAIRMTSTTDTIAISVILGVVLVSTTPRFVRLMLGLTCFATSWAASTV